MNSAPAIAPRTELAAAGENAQALLGEISEAALATARRLGATQAECDASVSSGLSVQTRLAEIESVQRHRSQGIEVSVYIDHCKGSASTSELSLEAARRTAEDAFAIARETAGDPCAGLADTETLAREFPDLSLLHPWPLDAEAAADIARAIETAGLAVDERIDNSEGAEVSSHRSQSLYSTSHGFSGFKESTAHSLSCVLVASEDGNRERDCWFSCSRRPDLLEDPREIGDKAARRVLRRLRPRRPGSGRLPVLFAPETAKGLIGHLLSAARGGALYRGTSFLVDRLGEAVTAPGIRIREEPLRPGGWGSSAWDYEGVARRNRTLVEDGRLESYILSSFSARKLGMTTTGNSGGVRNIVVEPTTTERDLARTVDKGIVVTELMGQGVDLTTGHYSRGAAGFWIEGGEVRHALNEFTIAGNLKDMYKAIVAIGADSDRRGNMHCGSLLIERMSIGGT